MLHTVLVILSIIGKIIACILGIILIFALLIVFLSIRYKINAIYHNNKYHVMVKVSWLFGVIGYRIEVKKNFISNNLSLFGIRVKKKSERKKRKKKIKTDNKENKELAKEIIFAPIEEPKQEEPKQEKSKQEPLQQNEPIGYKAKPFRFQKNTNKKNTKKSLKTRLKEKVDNFLNKIKGIVKHLKVIYHYLTDESNRKVFSFLKIQFFKLLHHIKPKKIIGNITFGFEDPSVTGRVLGMIAMVFGFLGKGIQITPDFEKSILEGELIIKGRIRVFNLLIIALKCYRNKMVRKAIKGLSSLKN